MIAKLVHGEPLPHNRSRFSGSRSQLQPMQGLPMEPICGLICRLALPDDPMAMDWSAMMERLTPQVDGFLLDFSFWQEPSAEEVTSPDLEYLETLLPYLPADRPLLIHVSGSTREQTLHNIEQLEAFFGNRGPLRQLVWVDLPLRYHSNRGLPELYQQFQQLTAKPVLLENDPDRVRRFKGFGQRANIRTRILKSLAQSSSVIGLIHHGDLSRALHYSRAAAGNRHFKVLDGNEQHFLEYPSTSGLVSVTANLVPADWAKMVAGARSSGIRTDHRAQYDALRNLKKLTAGIGDRPAAAVSYLLFLAGLLKSVSPVDETTAQQLRRLWPRPPQSAESCTAN